MIQDRLKKLIAKYTELDKAEMMVEAGDVLAILQSLQESEEPVRKYKIAESIYSEREAEYMENDTGNRFIDWLDKKLA